MATLIYSVTPVVSVVHRGRAVIGETADAPAPGWPAVWWHHERDAV